MGEDTFGSPQSKFMVVSRIWDQSKVPQVGKEHIGRIVDMPKTMEISLTYHHLRVSGLLHSINYFLSFFF